MNTEKVIKRDQKYIMHTYARSPLVLEPARACMPMMQTAKPIWTLPPALA